MYGINNFTMNTIERTEKAKEESGTEKENHEYIPHGRLMPRKFG